MTLSMSLRTTVASLALCALSPVISGCTSAAAPNVAVDEPSAPTPMFDRSIDAIQRNLDKRMEAGVPVPEPVDAGGGYTHEQHKQNGKTIYEAGMLYELTGDAEYRNFAASVLLDYAQMYPGLGLHPQQKEQTPGRLFWQSLNEAVWLVYTIQGYDAIRADLDPDTRETIETGVLRPMAEFLSEGQPDTFNKIHNHGTWAVAAVGMTGYALGEETWVNQALLGLDQSGDAGFLRQLDELFSPDGYYAEGPYYQRFALMPFILFAQAVEVNEPEREIFSYRDGILLKAVYATIQQSYAGRFFPINDAIREKGLNTAELRYALAIVYDLTGDPTLLDIVTLQDSVVPTPEGRKLARELAAGKAAPFEFKSILLRDGPAGDQGALAVLRSSSAKDAAAVVFKPTSQGLGHGHFDRLGLLYYDDGHEIVADYGAARFLNVEPKNGGHYLAENQSWAKQTIAHNALVVDQESQFGADWKVAQDYAPTVLAFEAGGDIQFTAAELDTAYDGVSLQRLVGMVPRPGGGHYVIDVMRARGEGTHSYDLPVHFKGQLIETSFELDHATTQLSPFGADNGYQHLWQRAVSSPLDDMSDISWLIDDQFYTLTFSTNVPSTAYLTQLGANDPNDNLRREQALVLRVQAEDADFVSVYEQHGRYDNDEEVTVFSGRSVTSISQTYDGKVAVYTITAKNGDQTSVIWAGDMGLETNHSITLDAETVNWMGPVTVRQKKTEPEGAKGR